MTLQEVLMSEVVEKGEVKFIPSLGIVQVTVKVILILYVHKENFKN